jgi:hypothetical protein
MNVQYQKMKLATQKIIQNKDSGTLHPENQNFSKAKLVVQ